MTAGGRVRVCERCPTVGAGVGASLESPGGGGKAVLPGGTGTPWHFTREGGEHSSFPAVRSGAKQKCLADACVCGVVFVSFNSQAIKRSVWRGLIFIHSGCFLGCCSQALELSVFFRTVLPD